MRPPSASRSRRDAGTQIVAVALSTANTRASASGVTSFISVANSKYGARIVFVRKMCGVSYQCAVLGSGKTVSEKEEGNDDVVV